MLVSVCNGTYCFSGSTHTGCLCVKSHYCECGWSGSWERKDYTSSGQKWFRPCPSVGPKIRGISPLNPPKQPTEFELGVVTLNEMNWTSHRLHLILQNYNSRTFTGQNTKVWLFSLMRCSFLWTALIMLCHYDTNSSPCKYRRYCSIKCNQVVFE